MKWTVSERPAEIGHGLTVFEIREEGRDLYVISAQSSEHCRGYGWTAGELRERVRLMAAAPALRDALVEMVMIEDDPNYVRFAEVQRRLANARAVLALLEAQEVEA